MNRPYAVFDIDGTLIRWQLFHAIVQQLITQGQLSTSDADRIRQARMTWKQRAHSESYKAYEAIVVQTYLDALKGLSITAYDTAVDAVFNEYKDQVYTYTRDLIRNLKADGYLLFAISGSQDEIVAKLAAHYGFDDHVGARFEQQGGVFTGRFDTPVDGKAALLRLLMKKHAVTFENSIGVGDSGSDISMLDLVARPIAFNPNRELFEHAKTAGWDIVVERKNVIYRLIETDGRHVMASPE